jgi:hypothetical protein
MAQLLLPFPEHAEASAAQDVSNGELARHQPERHRRGDVLHMHLAEPRIGLRPALSRIRAEVQIGPPADPLGVVTVAVMELQYALSEWQIARTHLRKITHD